MGSCISNISLTKPNCNRDFFLILLSTMVNLWCTTKTERTRSSHISIFSCLNKAAAFYSGWIFLVWNCKQEHEKYCTSLIYNKHFECSTRLAVKSPHFTIEIAKCKFYSDSFSFRTCRTLFQLITFLSIIIFKTLIATSIAILLILVPLLSVLINVCFSFLITQ